MSFLWGLEGLNGSVWPSEGPGFSGKWMHGLIQLAKCFLCGFCCISATKEPIQPYNLVSGVLKCNPLFVRYRSLLALFRDYYTSRSILFDPVFQFGHTHHYDTRCPAHHITTSCPNKTFCKRHFQHQALSC